jgi:magnesium-transporting ATPase (P-type)
VSITDACSHGPNALTPPKKPGFLAKLWAQLNNIMIWILLVSAIIVCGLQQWIEFGESEVNTQRLS